MVITDEKDMAYRTDARQQRQRCQLPRGQDMAVRDGRMQPKQVAHDSANERESLYLQRYALGRTNHDPDGGYGTSKFHVNKYFSTVTAVQMSNRRQWIVEIK